MAHKTYIPGAVDIAKAAHKYLTRWQSVLVSGQTAQRIAALADLILCLGTFLAEWQKPGPES
jgi:hypothetical protein